MAQNQTVPAVTPVIIPTLETQFVNFSKFGDAKSDGKTITLSQSDKWMKQAQVIGKKITTTDTGVCFNKFKARTINLTEFERFLADLAKTKNVDINEITTKLINCGTPGAQLQQKKEEKREIN